MPSARSVDILSLAEARTLVLQDAELRQSLVDIARPQAGGASKGGRYNKHDTARLRFIRDTALKGLRLGMLVPEEDFRMIRLPPMKELETHGSAVDKAAMAAWAERHGQRGGSKKSTLDALDEHEQQTLLCWVERAGGIYSILTRDPYLNINVLHTRELA